MRRARGPRTKRARARIALVTCVLWLAGFEVLPWMHIALHDQLGRHHHDASGAIVRDEPHDRPDADDDHDDAIDEHAAAHDHEDPDEDAEVDEHGAVHHHRHTHASPPGLTHPQALLAERLAHGRHSLAHHDVALHLPAPVMTSPIPIDRRSSFVLETKAIEPFSFSPGRAVARGPPFPTFQLNNS